MFFFSFQLNLSNLMFKVLNYGSGLVPFVEIKVLEISRIET